MTQRRRDEALAKIEEQRGRKWKDTVIYLPGRTILWEDFLDSVGGRAFGTAAGFRCTPVNGGHGGQDEWDITH